MNKKIILTIVGIIIIALVFIFLNESELISRSQCGDGICDAKEKQNPRVCPQDCKPIDNETETCGPDNQGYCIDFREKCKTGYEDIGPDICQRGRSAGCCVPIESIAKKTCSEQNGNFCSTSQTCSGSWLNASDSDRCCSGECVTQIIDYEDSPFGVRELIRLDEQNYAVDLGIKWIRYGNENGLSWGRYLELKENGQEEQFWEKFDSFYSLTEDNNLLMFFKISGERIVSETGPTIHLPEDMDGYKTFLREVAERYPNIKVWEFEEELENVWGDSWENYAFFLKESYEVIKQVSPNAKVAYPGLASEDEIKDTLIPVLAELNRIAGSSGKKYFDIITFKWSSKSNDAHYNHRFSTTLTGLTKGIKNTLEEYGYNDIPIWISAAAYNDDQPTRMIKLSPRTEKQQANEVLKVYVYPITKDISKIFWITITEYENAFSSIPEEGIDFFSLVGLINNPGNDPEEQKKDWKKLAYYTYKLMVEKLEGSDWDNIQTIQESDNIYIYKFMKNGEPVWVAWWDYFDDAGSSKTITIDVGNIDLVKITETVPDAEDGSKIDENDYPNFFRTKTKTASSAKVTITLGENPVFIEVIEGEEPEEKTCSELNGTICSSSQTCSGSWLDASDSGWCCGGVCEATVIDYEDSPFGFIQGEVVYGQRPDATFLIDLGVHWNKVAAKNGIRFPSKNINDINFDTEVDFTELDKYVKEIFVDNGIYMSIPLLTFVKINNKKILLTHDQYRELNTVLIERYNGDGVDDMEGSPKVKYWFVAGSEMNTGIGKGQNINKRKWKLSEADTAEYVKIGYDLIKSFDSEFKVLLGGSNSICTWQKDTPCIWREEPEPDEFYYNLVSEMTGNLFCPDMIFDYHYGSNPTQFKSQIEAMDIVKETLSEFGYANNDIWTTDVGGSWDGLGGFTEIEQSGDVVRRYTYTIAHGQEKLFWTRIEEYHWTPDDSSIFDHMGLINNPANADGKYWKKLSYYTYKLMVDKLEGSDWDNIKTIQESDNVYIYKFMKNGDSVWVAWWDYFDDSGSSKIITIDVGDINSVKITEAVPKYETGQEVTDYSTAFNVETKIVSGGKVEIILEESPVFVEAN